MILTSFGRQSRHPFREFSLCRQIYFFGCFSWLEIGPISNRLKHLVFVCSDRKKKKKFVIPKINNKPHLEKGYFIFRRLRNNNKKRLEAGWSQVVK